MTSQQILKKYLDFFEEREHKQVPNVSLIPENDPTLLYVNSGMFPLVPYLSGEKHPLGNKIMNVQRCLRFFEDLENVGLTNRHTTAFHMVGNWSLGDYFKKEQLNWVYEFYVEGLGLDPNKLYASVFAGDKDAPKDEESIEILKEVFAKYNIDAKEGERIFAYGKEDNWWQRGEAVGELGGPDSEAFYYIGSEGNGLGKDPADHQDEFIEIGNSVFMQYRKTASGWEELPQKNVDYGGGLERFALAVQGKQDIYQTDNFWPIIERIQEVSGKNYSNDIETDEARKVGKAMRILADHMRASTFLAMDGVVPSNKDQGYILRRLLRRMIRAGRVLGLEQDISVTLVPVVVDMFAWLYPDLVNKQKQIETVFAEEEARFRKVLIKGTKESEREMPKLSAVSDVIQRTTMGTEIAFDLYQSHGYPEEIFLEDIKDAGIEIDESKFNETYQHKLKTHQEESRKGAEQKFKGGLADHGEQVVKYHTTTHLLHWALRQVLGEHVTQQGSNITGARLRFDVSHDEKLTSEQVITIENLVNNKIKESHKVSFEIMPTEEAEKTGALHTFNEKYGEEVKVYFIGDSLENAVSKEFCGGPHVKNTNELDPIKVYKQEKIGEGILRIYAKRE
jgi:alanyl-tRNA synthetase